MDKKNTGASPLNVANPSYKSGSAVEVATLEAHSPSPSEVPNPVYSPSVSENTVKKLNEKGLVTRSKNTFCIASNSVDAIFGTPEIQ